jgi:hypothetical protein
VAKHRKLAAEATLKAVGNEMTPLEYLLRVMRHDPDEARRLDAAKAAAPYVHPRLATMEGNFNLSIRRHEEALAELDSAE